MLRVPATVLLPLLFTLFTFAQVPQGESSSNPQPSPQQQSMGYFVGDWTLTGTAKISPNSKAAPFHGTEHSEWVPGSFFVETHTKSSGPLGHVRATRVMEYNPQKNLYTYNVYNSLGEHQVAVGSVQGKAWVWTAEQQLNGVTTTARYTMTITSPNTYAFKSEVSAPNGAWATVMEGTATRTQQPPQ